LLKMIGLNLVYNEKIFKGFFTKFLRNLNF